MSPSPAAPLEKTLSIPPPSHLPHDLWLTMEGISSKHVILFPFMAQGHLIPFLALATLLEDRHRCAVTLVTTPLNIPALRSALPPASAIRLADLPFPPSHLHGLPPGVESTDKLPSHKFSDFLLATRFFEPSFELLVSETIQRFPGSCVVANLFFGWTVETARKLGVPHSVFVTCGAYGTAISFSIISNPPSLPANAGDDHDVLIPLPDYPEVLVPRSSVVSTILVEDGEHPMVGFVRRQISLCCQSDGFLLNTAAEVDEEGIGLLARKPGIRLWPIGPIVSPPNSKADERCIKWLESHRPGSVLYVSFGSQNSISVSQMMSLAVGLEASGTPFIWVVRPPSEFEGEGEFRAEWLPEGFEERMREKEKGLLVYGWAPQPEILSHPSTGGFLSHCGWNSVLESLRAGVPMIGWPLVGDQLFNSTMLEEMGACFVVARGKSAQVEGGWEGVERAIEVVMGGGKRGKEMKRRAEEIAEVMRGAVEEDTGSSVLAMEDFLRTVFAAS